MKFLYNIPAVLALTFWFFFGAWVPVSAQVGLATLGATLTGLQELRKSLESTVNTVDAESASKINQLSIAVDQAINELKSAIKDTSNGLNYNETKLFNDIFSVMSNVNSELERKGYLTYIGANASLANVATIMEGIPIFKVQEYLYATYPLRLRPTASDTLVSFYGHFPDVDDSHSASVQYKVEGLPEQSANLKRYIGGRLGFEIPKQYLKEGKFVNISVSVPKKRFIFFYGKSTFNTRVYIESLNAFSLKVDTFQENPALWAIVPSTNEHVERADSNRTSNIGSATAQQLFSTLINDDVKYVANSAMFAVMPSRIDTVLSPCWCNCSGSSARMSSWNANVVNWEIFAPSCGPQVCTRRGGGFIPVPEIQTCGGGGTHGEVYLKPTFRVKLRNQPDDALISSQSIKMQRANVWPSEPLPQNWDSISVTVTFEDGDEKRECQFHIPKEKPNGNCDLAYGEIASNILKIRTR